jgi:hypothetical protein
VFGEHAPRVAGEVAEQRVLHPGDVDRRRADVHLSRDGVDPQRPDLDHRRSPAGSAASQQRAHSAQLGLAERFGDHVVAAAHTGARARARRCGR